MFQKDEYCVLILGLDNAGKTVQKLSFDISSVAVVSACLHAVALT